MEGIATGPYRPPSTLSVETHRMPKFPARASFEGGHVGDGLESKLSEFRGPSN